MTLRTTLFSLCVALCTSGCAGVPSTYEMSIDEVRELRTDLGTVGITVSRYPVRREFAAPAKGWAGGFSRGFTAGAVKPVVVGMVSPVPGGTLAGILAAPFTALYGAFAGAASALPQETVELAEAGIDEALRRLAREELRQQQLEDFVRFARARTQTEFVGLPHPGPEKRDADIRYSDLGLSDIETVLEVRLERGGLWGRYDIDPPSAAYLETRVRLIRVSDNAVLLEDNVVGVGQQRAYSEWGANNGRFFFEEILRLFPRLQEKIIDDLFLVYPVSAHHQALLPG